MAAPARRFRVGGSKFTMFHFHGTPLLLANQVSHTSPRPVAQATAIQPIGAPYPEEIVTPVATGMGTLVLQVFEVYGSKIWDDLPIIGGSNDLAVVFNQLASTPDPISVTKHVYPPAGSTIAAYWETYNNAVISNIEDDEVIEVGTMQILKNITINYTHVSRSDAKVTIGPLSNLSK